MFTNSGSSATAAMPPKSRSSVERNSLQKQVPLWNSFHSEQHQQQQHAGVQPRLFDLQSMRQSKSRSKERGSCQGQQSSQMAASQAQGIIGQIEGSKVNLQSNTIGQESANDLALFRQIDNHEMSVQQPQQKQWQQHSTSVGPSAQTESTHTSSAIKQPRMNKATSLGQKGPQNPLQIPSQRPIYRLLQAFKLHQYAKSFVDEGFGDDVYKLTMMTHRKRQELIDSIELMPGHKQRFLDLFRRIDNMYPRQNVQRTLDNAIRICSSRQSGNSRMSLGAIGESDTVLQNQSMSSTQPVSLLNAQASVASDQQPVRASGIPQPTQFARKDKQFGRSPPSQGQQPRRQPGCAPKSNSLARKFAGLDPGTRTAINDSFLQNLRSGKAQVTTVADALKEFYGKDTKAKQSVINKIFGNPLAANTGQQNQRNSIKTHHTLAQANPNGGFGLGKFVKVQKGTTVIDRYKSQISSQASTTQTMSKTATTIQNNKRQNSRTEAQPPRRMLDKKTKNSNSSSDSKKAQMQLQAQRKGSHPAQSRKKNTSNSSERKEVAFGALAAANSGSASKKKTAMAGMQPVLGNSRMQIMTQQRQQRVTSHSRIQLTQNSNFMIAPDSSRGDFGKAPAVKQQQSTKNSTGGSTLLNRQAQQQPPQGRTRLHRVRSAAGYKDVQAEKEKASASQATSTINSIANKQQNTDYASQQSTKKASGTGPVISSGQQAAMKRLQLHRQRSAKKQLSQTSSHQQELQERHSLTAASKRRAKAGDSSKPPTAASASSSTAIPTFIQQQPKTQQSVRNQPSQPLNRRQVSKDRQAQLDITATSSSASIANKIAGKQPPRLPASAAKADQAEQSNSSFMQQTANSGAETNYGIGSSQLSRSKNATAGSGLQKLKRASSLGVNSAKPGCPVPIGQGDGDDEEFKGKSRHKEGANQTACKITSDLNKSTVTNQDAGQHHSNPKNTNTNAQNNSNMSQSAALTEFRLPPDSLTPSDKKSSKVVDTHNDGMLPAISSTVKKANQKAELAEAGSEVTPKKLVSGKPPISQTASSARRSTISKVSDAINKTAFSPDDKVFQSPLKRSITGASPKRPLVLEPIENPPSVGVKPAGNPNGTSKLVTSGDAADGDAPADEVAYEQTSPFLVNHEEDNVKWTPLLDKSEKCNARDYGYSFGSKKVAMGPGFINLRFMCHCLARAIKRHLEFSKGEHWFLQDLQQEQDDVDLEFSYQLPPDLKLTLNPKGVRVTDDDDDDANPFQREEDEGDAARPPLQDIETTEIQVDARVGQSKKQVHASQQNSAGQHRHPGGEPEPESIKSSDGEDSIKKVSNFVKDLTQFSSQKPLHNDELNNMIGEELDEDEDDDAYSQQDFENEEQQDGDEDPEEQSIRDVRREELRKSIFEKDEKRINDYLNQRKVSELQEQLKTKDKQIAQLTRLVSSNGMCSEILAISDAVDTAGVQEGADVDGQDRAEWLMAQVDLDPIESHGSMEMSTTKFKSLHGHKRILNSDGNNSANTAAAAGVSSTLGNAADSSRTQQDHLNAKQSIKDEKEKQAAQNVKEKKKSAKSYESAYVDVSEDKMREFAMSQLRHFDVRMEYDNLIFNEDQFIPMPSEKYIADYCKYVTIACKMENEIPIVCLVYLEKLLLTTGILLNKWNWRRIVLICLCLASKIWDDDSLENVHFPKVMSDVTNYEINKLEQLFLEFIDYKLVIKGAEYAKYYFILRTMAEDIQQESDQIVPLKGAISPFENTRRNQSNKEEWAEFPLRAPISAEKMLELQRQEAKAEVYLKERHEREFLIAYIGNKEGSRKDHTRHPSLLLDRTL